MIPLPQPICIALAALSAAGFEAYVVGGAVRDMLRGVRAHDWDITTNALPEELCAVFSGYRVVKTGLSHGTVTVWIAQLPIEITTYRIDGAYTDHRHPDTVHFTRDLRQDLARRDFTINAIAYHPQSGLVDPTGGAADLARGLIRCVGDAERRFREDGLRILRALRFSATLCMRLEAQTAAAVHACRTLLRNIAAERIHAELSRLLCGDLAAQVLDEYSNVVAVILPELAPMFGFLQHNPHHDRDVWQHTLAVLAHTPRDAALRWAALLHDAGKPACFSTDQNGIGHFYGHAKESAALAGAILTRLRFDHAAKARIVTLVRYHNAPIPPDERRIKRLLAKHGAATVRDLLLLQRADTCGQPPALHARLAEHDRAEAVLDDILQREDCFSLRTLAIRGDDLLALGLRGRAVGEALDACLHAVIDATVPNERGALLAYVKAQKL